MRVVWAVPDRSAAGTLEGDVGPEVYQQLLTAFLGNLPILLADLNRAADAGDVPAARFAAHQINGSAPSFGATDLDELAHRVLWLGRDQGYLLPSLVDRIEREIGQFLDQAAGAAGDTPADGARTLEADVGPEVYQQLLAAFLRHLRHQVGDLKNAAEVGDVPGARFIAHQINGSAPSFGAARLDALADRVLLIAGDQGDLLWALVGEIEGEAGRLQAVLGR